MYKSVTIVNIFFGNDFSKQDAREAMKLSQHLDKIKRIIKELVAVRVKMIDRDQ